MVPLAGCIPILCTPFDRDGEIVLDDLTHEIDWVLEAGANGVATLAIASEGYKLTEDERDVVVQHVIGHVKGRAPVVVSADGAGSRVAVERAKKAEAAGADAIMVLPPYFVKPSRASLEEYYGSIASVVATPVIVQDAPQLTGVPMSPELWHALNRQNPNLSYVKVEGTPQGATISATLQESEGRLSVFCGWGGLGVIDALERGAIGTMPAPNFTAVFAETQERFQSGDKDGATELINRWLPYIVWTMQSVDFSVAAAKSSFIELGVFRSSFQRQPVTPLDDVSRRQLREWIARASRW